MKTKQLSLFIETDKPTPHQKPKQPKLGRYERLKRELEKNDNDPYKIFIEVNAQPLRTKEYTFVDLFCGAGGMTQGLVQAGFKPIASVEINPIASATYVRNFFECHHFCGDIEEFEPISWLEQIGSPQVHLVVGGPPCQGFSIAGKRDPNDPHNFLFYEFLRVVAQIKPWYVVMENVPGILTMKKGAIKESIFEIIAKFLLSFY